MKSTFILILLGFLSSSSEAYSEGCTLSFGYRTNARQPLINEAPDNNGLYFELYSMAAKKLGCKLEVIRAPKKRILAAIKSGKIDLYPGFNFTEKRSDFAFYMENGLPGGDVGLSRADFKDVKDLEADLKGKILLHFFGSPIWVKGKEVNVKEVRETDLAKAIQHLQGKKVDFFIYNKQSIKYYLKMNKLGKDFKIHRDCCGGIKPLYLAFSRKSKHYQEEKNPAYEPGKPLAPENFPVRLKKSTIAYKLGQILLEMKSDFTKKLYQKNYGY